MKGAAFALIAAAVLVLMGGADLIVYAAAILVGGAIVLWVLGFLLMNVFLD